MPTATREGNILQIGDTIRIESGPVLRRAEATRELLDDAVTASHYTVPRTATAEEIADPAVLTVDGMATAFDALGQPIKLGEEMAYLDWLGHNDGTEGATGFYVYQLDEMTSAERKERELTDADLDSRNPPLSDEERAEATQIWREIGCAPDEGAAITLATDTLLAKGA